MRNKKKIEDIAIIDFGLASFVDVDKYLYERCGTPGFVAPEIFAYISPEKSNNYNEKCDIFSVGIIFYML